MNYIGSTHIHSSIGVGADIMNHMKEAVTHERFRAYDREMMLKYPVYLKIVDIDVQSPNRLYTVGVVGVYFMTEEGESSATRMFHHKGSFLVIPMNTAVYLSDAEMEELHTVVMLMEI